MQYLCRLQEQQFSEFTRVPERKLQMHLLTDIHLESKVGILKFVMVRIVTVDLADATNRSSIKNMH